MTLVGLIDFDDSLEGTLERLRSVKRLATHLQRFLDDACAAAAASAPTTELSLIPEWVESKKDEGVAKAILAAGIAATLEAHTRHQLALLRAYLPREHKDPGKFNLKEEARQLGVEVAESDLKTYCGIQKQLDELRHRGIPRRRHLDIYGEKWGVGERDPYGGRASLEVDPENLSAAFHWDELHAMATDGLRIAQAYHDAVVQVAKSVRGARP